MPDPARIPTGSPSTDRTKRRSSCGSYRGRARHRAWCRSANMVYVARRGSLFPGGRSARGRGRARALGDRAAQAAETRRREFPEWFTFPTSSQELRRTHPPRVQQGLTVFFTGLSGAGQVDDRERSAGQLLELGGRPVTLLDGDLVRKHLSSELGFSKEHRDINIRRIGFVASEITKNGGIAICAPIAPYDDTRRRCGDDRAAWRLPARARRHAARRLRAARPQGPLRQGAGRHDRAFTGISDPYEEPDDAEVTVDTSQTAPATAAEAVLAKLVEQGYLERPA